MFTLPEELHPLALGNKKTVFDILFAAAAETLQEIAHDDKHLGAQLGFTAVLHTWGQNLLFHPHLHCVVTGGGLSPEGDRWIPARKNYFLPVRVLGALFRGKFLHRLHDAYRQGRLALGAGTAPLAHPPHWRALLDGLYRKAWVVYAKTPFDGTEHVFRYLARYTHRVAIANRRIVAFQNARVIFTLKDHAEEGKRKRMTLDVVEFLRRFLLHVLPKGFSRIRHYGLYAARNVDTRCAIARHRLAPQARTPNPQDMHPVKEDRPWWERLRARTGIDLMACPHCRAGRLVRQTAVERITEVWLAPTGTDPPFPDAWGR
ncbi:MAG: transposase [Candidatus Eisenbacteria bacterium]